MLIIIYEYIKHRIRISPWSFLKVCKHTYICNWIRPDKSVLCVSSNRKKQAHKTSPRCGSCDKMSSPILTLPGVESLQKDTRTEQGRGRLKRCSAYKKAKGEYIPAFNNSNCLPAAAPLIQRPFLSFFPLNPIVYLCAFREATRQNSGNFGRYIPHSRRTLPP